MKNPAKAIKIVSVITLILGIIVGIFGLLITVGGGAGAYIASSEQYAAEIDRQMAEDPEVASALDELSELASTDVSASAVGTVVAGGIAALGIITLLAAIFDIVLAILGLRAAKGKNPKPAFIIGIIDIIFVVISAVTSFKLDVATIISIAVSFILPVIYTYAAAQLKKDYE